VLLRYAVVICLSATIAYGQGDISDRDGLVNALFGACRGDLSCSSKLLNQHKSLVTPELWRQTLALAESPLALPPASFDIPLQIATQLGDKRLQGLTYYNTARYYFGQGKIDRAIESYTQSKAVFEQGGLQRDLIYVLADLGLMYIYKGDYEAARRCSQESLAVAQRIKNANVEAGAWPDEYGIGTALSNLGYISRRSGDYEKALDYFQQSLVAYRKINTGGKHDVDVLDGLAELGRTYNAQGDYLRALSYLSQAMDLASRYEDRVASICNSIGIIYTNQRDYTKAVDYFQRGLTITDKNGDEFRRAELLLNIGVAYQFQEDYLSALKSFEASLVVARQIHYAELFIPIYEGRGTVLKAQAKYKEALDALDSGLQLARQSQDKTRIAELLWRESEVFLASGDASKSIESASLAAQLADQLSLQNVRYLALTNLGKSYRAAGQNDLAMQTFKKATAQIEQMRKKVAGLENERQLFFEDKVIPYHEMVDMLISQNRDAANEEALLIAESAKARVLLDVFSAGRINLARAMSDRDREEDRRLNQRIVDLNNQIGEENRKAKSDGSILKSLADQLRQARSAYETFRNSLYAAHPELSTNRPQTTAATMSELAPLMNENTAFLEYVVTDSKTYLMAVTESAGSIELRAYPISASSSELGKRTRVLRDEITTESAFADDARKLYDLLLRPAEQQLKGKTSLCFVPDGILWDLPFQALEPRDGRYLLEDYAISYAPSLSVLKEMSVRNSAERAPASLLAFGNPTLPSEIAANLRTTYRGENLGPLPEAEIEVSALKTIWGTPSSRVLVGPDARKSVFLQEASKYSIIHLATHGILDDASPMYSRLIMARAENDATDDGLLEAREIMQLNLRADLVILSACQTARGRIGAGEGMVGMSWAFFVAGVPSMVASQWKVNSASTAKLMVDLHKRLKEQSGEPETKARALQQASLGVMKDPRYRHPYYWAGFVLLGKN
jgi:CHAT domain-containing protein